MRRLFNDEQVAFFKNEDELSKKIKYFQAEDEDRQTVAAAGRHCYQQHFSAQQVINFIIETTFEQPYTTDYPCAKEVYY